MPKRPPYCIPRDVLRLFDAQESLDQLSDAELDLIRDAIDDVSSDFERKTNHAFRLTPVGAPGTPSNWDYQGIEGSHRRPPVRVDLDHRYVRPFDPDEGDVLEVRESRDSWEDVTGLAGDEYILKYESGGLKLYRWLIKRIFWEVPDDRYVRARYRYGALGGRHDQGGQTTLDGSLGGSDSDTTVTVANAGHIFADTLLIYGDNVEYVDVESVDYDADTLTVSRGERSTDPASHSDGDVVHYCPNGARMAMAGKAAEEGQLYELFTDRLVQTGDGVSATDRIDHWASQYEKLLAEYSDVHKM